MDKRLLGQILLGFNLVTEDQLHKALDLQIRRFPDRFLGQILVEEGILDEKTLESILAVQRRKLEIGQAQDRLSAIELSERLAGSDARVLLRTARELGASDLYLASGARPTVRIHGTLTDLGDHALPFEEARELLFSLLTPEEIAEYYARKTVERGLHVPDAGRFRMSVFRHLRGIAGVFRVVAEEPRCFEDLGLPRSVLEFTRLEQGLVVVAGPTGSGKSTTLAALLEVINRTREAHVVTLEDPIEVVFRNRRALFSQREIRTHTESCETALRAALRSDPDVLVVGEMRDPEMVATAITAAETGHVVYGTLHTHSAPSTILRVVDQFPPQKRTHVRMMLAAALRGVICQHLIPDSDGRGRSLACEVMITNPAIAKLIREDRVWQIPMVMQMGGGQGMRLMDDSLAELVRAKRITLDEALHRATEKEKLLHAA